MRPTYVRFVTLTLDKSSGRRCGVFQAVYALIESNQLSAPELDQLQSLRDWFKKHLDTPDRFSRSPRQNAAHKAISWYKSSATDYISRMHAMCRILNEHGIATEMLTSARPGYIVFEDDYQIAAEPFAETAT